MKIQNKSKHPFQHSYFDEKMKLVSIEIAPGEIKDIKEEIAKVWIKTGECVEFVAPEDLKAKEEKLNKEIEKLKAENKKLKAGKCASCYENGKTPAQEDCNKCKKTTTSAKTAKK